MITNWIAADMGRTVLRLWAMSGRTPVEERSLDRGTGDEPVILTEGVAGWPMVPIVVCGMALPAERLVPVPCPVAPRVTVRHDGPGGRPLHRVDGLRQNSPDDIMQGHETRIAGLLAVAPDFDGTVCLPGAHPAWVRVSAGEICNFSTFMTGELFGLIAGQSLLRNSVDSPDQDRAAFRAALSDAMARPERAYAGLVRLHAQSQLSGLDPATARARLSGTLIGWELAAARPWWLGCEVTIIGPPALSDIYADALDAQGVPAARLSARDATLAGLWSAFRQGRA